MGELEPEGLAFRLPASILRNRDGEKSDSVEMSLPTREQAEASESGAGEAIDSDTHFAWYADGDEIVVYNFREIKSGDGGYAELSYATTEQSYAYGDLKEMEPFTATATVTKDGKSQTLKADPIATRFDTTAEIVSTDKKYPTRYSTWNDAWGTEVKPANAGDYQYLIWQIATEVAATQPYSFAIDDEVTGNADGAKVIGYRFAGQKTFGASSSVENQTATNLRYDAVITAIEKSKYENLDYWKMVNVETATVTPYDKIDEETYASSARTWTWEKPTFSAPRGTMSLNKRGDGSYRADGNVVAGSKRTGLLGFSAADYSRYDLEAFSGKDGAEKTLDEYGGLDYAVWVSGYPYGWTYSGNPLLQESYGAAPVTFDLIDEGASLEDPNGGGSVELGAGDFRFSGFNYGWKFTSARFDEASQSFKETAAAAERLSSVSAKNARAAVTGADGIADFGDLDPGAYLVKQFYAEGAASGYEKVEPFIAYLPQWTDGKWERDVTAMPKTAPAKTGRVMGETEPVRKTTETPAGSETEADAKGKTEEPQGGGGGAETDGGNGQGARNGPKTGDATPVSETLAVMFLALAIALTAAGKLKGGRSKT